MCWPFVVEGYPLSLTAITFRRIAVPIGKTLGKINLLAADIPSGNWVGRITGPSPEISATPFARPSPATCHSALIERAWAWVVPAYMRGGGLPQEARLWWCNYEEVVINRPC